MGAVVAFDRSSAGSAIEMWNALAEEMGFAKVQVLTEARRVKLNARLKDCGGIDGWGAALDKIRRSGFLSGRDARGRGHENWRCNFDFLLQASSFTKILEGVYDDKGQQSRASDREAILRGLGANRMARAARIAQEPDGRDSPSGVGQGASERDPDLFSAPRDGD